MALWEKKSSVPIVREEQSIVRVVGEEEQGFVPPVRGEQDFVLVLRKEQGAVPVVRKEQGVVPVVREEYAARISMLGIGVYIDVHTLSQELLLLTSCHPRAQSPALHELNQTTPQQELFD